MGSSSFTCHSSVTTEAVKTQTRVVYLLPAAGGNGKASAARPASSGSLALHTAPAHSIPRRHRAPARTQGHTAGEGSSARSFPDRGSKGRSNPGQTKPGERPPTL